MNQSINSSIPHRIVSRRLLPLLFDTSFWPREVAYFELVPASSLSYAVVQIAAREDVGGLDGGNRRGENIRCIREEVGKNLLAASGADLDRRRSDVDGLLRALSRANSVGRVRRLGEGSRGEKGEAGKGNVEVIKACDWNGAKVQVRRGK